MKVLQNYVNFSGRAQRAEFWFFFLVNLIIGFVLGFGSIYFSLFSNLSTIATLLYYLYVIYSLFIFLPVLAVSVRRLHDVGQSGWMLLIGLIPLIGFIVLLVFFVMDSEKGSNKYGPNPKGINSGGDSSENHQQA